MRRPSFTTVVTAAALLDTLRWHRSVLRSLAPPRTPHPQRADYPSVSVIRPVRDLDVDAASNLASALDIDYPAEVETLFVFDDESDPAFPIAERIVETHRQMRRPGRASVHVAGPPPPGRTGKLNAMIHGLELARGTLIAFGDSDTRPGRHLLRHVVDTLLTTPRAGSAFAPVVVRDALETVGDVGYALLVNALYGGTSAVLAGEDRALPFIMGQLMVLRREAIAAIGGLEAADGQFVDDMWIGKEIHHAGFRNIMTTQKLPIRNGDMRIGTFLRLLRRWTAFSRTGLPTGFMAPMWIRGLEAGLGLLLGIKALARGQVRKSILPMILGSAFGLSLLRIHRAFGGAPIPLRHAWVPWALLLSSPIVLATISLSKGVDWRGRTYALDHHARLAA